MKNFNTFFKGITYLLCLFSLTMYGQTFNSSPNAALPDNSCDSSNEFEIAVANVSSGFSLSEVGVNITHTWNDDLDIYLITPNGQEIELSTDNGSQGDGYDDVVFTDSATDAILSFDFTTITFSGEYRPEEVLTTAGTETNGIWTLRVCDDAGGDTGTLNSWSLTFIEPPCFAATGVTTSFIADNCGYVDVNITTVNDAVSITDGINSWAISGPGITQVGPFAEGETVNLSIIHDVSDCNFDLDEFDYSCPPANDSCANAIPLDCDTSISGSTVAATNQDIGTCVTALGAGPGVWYTIMGTGLDITIDTEGSDFDTKLGVFEGSCNSLVCVDGDDDSGSGTLSELTFSSTEGVTYYIYVTGFLQNTGNYVLNVDCACKASMNECTIVYTSFGPAASTDLTVVAEYGVEPYTYEWSDGQSGQTITVAPTSTQVYSVLVTDAEGCTSTAVTNVLVSDIDITCPNNNNSVKVTLCHDGQEICVSENAVQAHLNHGDFLGSCNPDFDCSTAPLCDASLKVPEPEATNISTQIEIVWSAASGLVGGYYLSVGTTNGGTDILNAVDVGNTLEYDLNGLLDFETTYYVTVIAYNDNGVATNCQASDYFTTEESPCNQAQFTECDQTYSGSTVGLPVQNGLSCDISLDTSGGAWYLFIGNGDEVTVDTNGSSFDTRLGVFSGTCDALVCVDGDDDGGDGNKSLVTFISSPGIPYFIYVTGYLSNEGDYDLNITCIPPPTCDDGIQNGNETGVDCGGPDCEECPPLPGQNCDNAEVVACGDTISASTANYPVHPELSSCSGILDNAGGRFYKFTGTGGVINANTNGSSIDTVLGLFTGDCNALTCVASDDDGGEGTRSLITFNSVDGQDYYIYVSGYGSTGDVTLNVTCGPPPPPPPANDECANATPVTVNADLNCGSVTPGTIANATASGDNQTACSGTENDDVWFSFVATATSHKIDLLNVAPYADLYHSVWSGTCGTLTNVSCSDSNSSTVSGLTIGNTYLLRVNSYNDNTYTSTFNVCIGTPPPPPANDECTNATPVTVNADLNCGSVTPGTIANATASGDNQTACYGTENDDVWFSFVATATSHKIDLLNVTPYADLYHSVWSGTCGTLTNVSCSDPNSSTVSGLTIGNTYLLRVNSYYNNTYTSTFNVCIGTVPPPPPPPANDDCANAIELIVGSDLNCSNPVYGSTESATQSLSGCAGTADDDVWYSFTASGTKHSIIIENLGGSSDIVTQVFDACGGASLICQDTPNSPVNLTGLTAGTTYYFRIYTYYSGSISEFNVCVGTPPPPPANEACSGAIPLICGTTLNATTNGTTGTNTENGGCTMSAYGSWFTFVGNGLSTTVTTVAASGYDHEMSISSGSCGSLVNVACRDTAGGGGTETYAFTSVAGTTYYVYVAQYSGTSTTTGNFTINVSSCQAARIANPELEWSMYPNPATRGEVQLDLTNYLNQDLSIQMMDYSGKTLMNNEESNLQNPRYRVNTQNMPNGMYFVRVVTESGTSIKKLIIAN